METIYPWTLSFGTRCALVAMRPRFCSTSGVNDECHPSCRPFEMQHITPNGLDFSLDRTHFWKLCSRKFLCGCNTSARKVFNYCPHGAEYNKGTANDLLLLHWVKVSQIPFDIKPGHARDVLPSRPLCVVLNKINLIQQKQRWQSHKNIQTKARFSCVVRYPAWKRFRLFLTAAEHTEGHWHSRVDSQGLTLFPFLTFTWEVSKLEIMGCVPTWRSHCSCAVGATWRLWLVML